MKCLNCDNEFDAKRATAKYCSAKCRKLAFLRPKVSVLEEEDGTLTRNAKPIDVTLKDGVLDADIPEVDSDLPDGVPDIIRGCYERNGQEYRDVIDRLLSHTLAELELKGIWIPRWRYNMEVA